MPELPRSSQRRCIPLSSRVVSPFFAGLLLSLLLTGAAWTEPARAQVRATCETARDDVVRQYVERTREWASGTYQFSTVAGRGENATLATYRVAPDRGLQAASALAAPFEVYLDLDACRVVGEYMYLRERVRTADQSGENVQ